MLLNEKNIMLKRVLANDQKMIKNETLYMEAKCKVQRRNRNIQETWQSNKADEIQYEFDSNDSKLF